MTTVRPDRSKPADEWCAGPEVPVATHDELTEGILGGLFAQLERLGVEYCVLRNFETLPGHLASGDVDILVDAQGKDRARSLIAQLSDERGVLLYDHFRDDRLETFRLVKRLTDRDVFKLQIDLFTDTEVYGIRLVPGREVLARRVRHGAFFVASEPDRVLDKWLFNLFVGEPLPEKYHAPFRGAVMRHRAEVERTLIALFGRRLGPRLVESIVEHGFDAIGRLTRRSRFAVLLRAALRNPVFHFKHAVAFTAYRIRYLLAPRGEFVSVSGPDGSGKSTILGAARPQLEHLFGSMGCLSGHSRPHLLPRLAEVARSAGVIASVDVDYAAPHRARSSRAPGSLARLAYYMLDYVVGYWVRIRPTRVRRELVLFDRYCYDMVADPGRSRIALPAWLLRALLFVVPLPTSAFFVRVRASIASERKQELSQATIERLNAAYLQLARSGHLHVLENASTIEHAAAALVDAVVARRRGRLQLDRAFPTRGVTAGSADRSSSKY